MSEKPLQHREPSPPAPLPPAGEGKEEGAYRVAVGVAAVAGVFCIAVLVLLGADFTRRLVKDPLDSPEFKNLKLQLAQRPQDEKLKTAIRELDLELRDAYFRQRRFTEVGAYLLLAGCVVFLAAARAAATLRRRLPKPSLLPVPQDTDSAMAAAGRWAVAGLATALVGAAVALSLGLRSELPDTAAQLAKPSPTAPLPPERQTSPEAPTTVAGASAVPTDEEVRKNWPRFRGPDGSGISAYANVPTTWDGPSGKNILWKAPVPLGGHNSPIVWNGRVFLCGADESQREVYSFDANSGKMLWQRPAPGPAKPPAKPLELNEESNAGWSAPTMTTDGQRVFAIFPVGELVAFDFAGKQVWNRSFGVPVNIYGHSSSLLVYRDLLVVQMDQGGPKDGLSRLYALEAATGRTVWEVKREVPNSWATPIVVQAAGRAQLITVADPFAIAYDPADGKEIWRAKCLRQDVGPSPVFANGIVYVANQFPCLTALRPDGTGDVTESHTLWIGEDGLPDTCSPLATEQFVLLLTSEGTMTCYDAKEGKRLWEQDFEANFRSSPSLVGKLVYLFSDEGKTWVVEPTPTACKPVAEAELGEGCSTCPAFQDGRMYVRGQKHLFCIGNK